MSTESKKKRGESGVSNAKHIPFRYHGLPKHYTLSNLPYGTNQFGGSLFLNAMILGSALPNFQASERMYKAADAAMEKCSVLGQA